MADDLRALLGEPDVKPTTQTDLVSLLGEPDVKKKEEPVVGVGESGDSRSLSSTPDREFLQDTEVIVPELPHSRENLSFQAEPQVKEQPNYMGLFNKKEQISSGINTETLKQIDKSAQEADYPTSFLFRVEQIKKRLDNIPKYFPDKQQEAAQLKQSLANINKANIDMVDDAVSAIEESKAISPMVAGARSGGLYNQPLPQEQEAYFQYNKNIKDTEGNAVFNQLIRDTEIAKKAASMAANEGFFGGIENIVKGYYGGLGEYFTDYGRIREQLKANPKIKELTDKLIKISEGENIELNTEDRLLAQMVLDNYNVHQELDEKVPQAYKIGGMGGTSAGFTLEFILTQGRGSAAAQKITSGITKALAEGAAVSGAKKLGVGLAAKLAHAGIQTAWMPSYWKNTAVDVSKGEDFSTSVMKNYYKSFAENFSERVFMKNPWNKSVVGTVDNALSKMGVNMHTDKGAVGVILSTLEESTEEKISELMTAPVDYNNFDKFWKDYWDVKKNAEMIASVSLMTVPMGIVSQAARTWDNVQLNKIGKLLPSGVRSEIDEVLNDKKLTVKEQFDLVGRIVEDHAADKTLGDSPAEAASNIIRYTQQKTKSNVVSAVEERAQTPTVGTMEEITTEDQAKLDYLESKGVKVPDGSTMATVNGLYEQEKQKEPSFLDEPTQEQRLKDLQEGNIVTFTYNTEEEVPDILKDKISSKSTLNGVTEIKVTLPKSEADYLLQKQKDEIVSVAAKQVSETKPKEEVISPIEPISEPVEPRSPQEAPIVSPEQKEGLKRQKQRTDESATELKKEPISQPVSSDKKSIEDRAEEVSRLPFNARVDNLPKAMYDFYNQVFDTNFNNYNDLYQHSKYDLPGLSMNNPKSFVEDIKQSGAYKAKVEQERKQKQQPTVVEPQITKVEQLTTKQDGKETSDETQGGQKGRQEVLIEAQQKTIREVKREENKQRLASIFDDIATLTGARKEITGEERRIIRKRILDNTVEYIKTEFELVGDALREKVKSFLKENNFSDEDIVDEEIDNSIKEKGYAKGTRTTTEEAGQQAQGVVEGEKRSIRVRDDAQDRLEAQKGEGVRATASKTHKPTAKETTTKIGRFAVRVTLDETKVPQAVKDAFVEKEIGKYNTMTDAQAMGIAEGIAAANTYEEMKKVVFDEKVHPSVRGAIVLKVKDIMNKEFRAAEKAGNEQDMNFWTDETIDFLEKFNDKIHETALTLRFVGTQAFLDEFAPYQHVREYKKKTQEERDELMNTKTHKKSQERVKKEAKKIRDKAIDDAVNDPTVQKIINKNEDKEPTFVPKDRLKQLKEKERAAIEKLRKAIRGGTLTSGGLNSEALEALGELAVVYVEEAGYVVAKAVKKLIKTAKDVGITLTEKQAQELLPKEIDGKPIEDKIAEEAKGKASEKLASRIFGEVISSRKKEDPLLQMVNTLLGKFKERDLVKEKKEPKTDIQKIAEAISNKEQYAEVWAEAKDQAISKIEENETLTEDQKQAAIDRINTAYDKATSFTFTEAQIDRAIKKKSASLGIRIDQIVKEFYDIQTTERGRLVDALIEESGLEAEQAKLLAQAIENRFDTLLAEGKKKIVDKYIGKITGDKTEAGQITTKTRKDAVSEFLELVNIGAFQSEAFREAYATAVGIPTFTQAHADKIDKLAKEIRRQKEPIMKHKATQELMGYRQIIAGFGLSDIMTAAWYGNVLGNIKTQERNFFGGWTGVASRLMAEAMVTGRPRAIFRGYIKSMREAATKFKDVWTEGYAPFSERIDVPPTVELIKGTGMFGVLMNYWRYTRRAMDALDVWNATTGKIAFAEILANEALNVNRFKATFNSKYRREVNKLVDKYLSVDAETVKRLKQEIEDDAAEFGYTDIDKKLILYDKIDRLRPTEVSEQAIKFGIFSTGNVQAYGTLGIISDNLAKLFRFKLPVYKNSKTGEVRYIQPLSFIAAFTKIAGNVGTMSMNFVPGVGVYRIVQGGYGKLYTSKDGKANYFSKYSVDLTEREKKTIIGMQIAGTVSMALLWGLSDPGDDDDPIIRVTADGTGDWTKNRAISGEEWKEYSIGIKNPTGGRTWISYKYSPMIIPFSPIGFIRDSKKYRKEYKDKDTLELLGETLLQMPSALADMTALSSMNDFMSGVLKLGETAEYSKVIKSLERIVSGFYTPGLYRDVVDAVEAMYGLGVDEPMKGVPEYEVKLLKERFMGKNPISIYRRIKNGTEYVDRVDVYGRKVEKVMPYNDVIDLKPEMNEEEKLIFRHQKIMGNPSVPQVKQTFFLLDNPDGSTTKIFLNTSDPYQDELWHKYIIMRGRAIVESMSLYQDADEETYTTMMEGAIQDATEDARFNISYELNANPPKKIKEWQKARTE